MCSIICYVSYVTKTVNTYRKFKYTIFNDLNMSMEEVLNKVML